MDIGSHNGVADSLAGLSSFPNLTADQYFDQFFCEAKRIGAKRMILSAEHFFGGEPRIWDVPDEDSYFERYPRKIRALKQYLDGHEVSLLVYLRPQVDWLASAISQTVRTEQLICPGKPIYKNDRQFFEMVKPLLRYHRLIDTWVNCLHPREVMVVPYERKFLYKNSTIADFLYRTGLDNLNLPFGSEALQVNQSISREYIEVKKILNLTPRKKNEERVIITCLERLSACSEFSIPYRLSEELSREVSEFVALENERINERFVQGDCKLKAQSAAYKSKNNQIKMISEKDIAAAMSKFEREFSSPRARLLRLDYAVRAFLRNHAKPLHSLLHQLKRIYRARVYRKR